MGPSGDSVVEEAGLGVDAVGTRDIGQVALNVDGLGEDYRMGPADRMSGILSVLLGFAPDVIILQEVVEVRRLEADPRARSARPPRSWGPRARVVLLPRRIHLIDGILTVLELSFQLAISSRIRNTITFQPCATGQRA